ncbi:MAG: hypothetical protein ACKVOH_01500, partial [Chlamydiales bacterium]
MKWFPFVNLVSVGLIGVILFFIFLLVIPKKEKWEPPQVDSSPKNFPISAFANAPNGLDALNAGALQLSWTEPKMQLPALHNELICYGVVERPDISADQTLVHLSFARDEKIHSFPTETPIYLVYNGFYQKAQKADNQERIFATPGEAEGEGGYSFSPQNRATPLWIIIQTSYGNKKFTAQVHMLDERGGEVSAPEQNSSFALINRDIPKARSVGWEIDGCRVDSTLLIRQKARWVGKDRFLELHGGEDFAHTRDLQRIDFLSDEVPYSCFVQEGSFLIWKEGRWQGVSKDCETIHLPLLVVKKIEEKMISCELWDPEGKGKILLSLIRSKDLAGFPDLQEEFKFMGAKTWAKFIVESHDERLILKPHDWLVLTSDGWVK